MWIKEWFIEREALKALEYNKHLDYAKISRSGKRTLTSKDGYIDVDIVEIIDETEKAIRVVIRTGGAYGRKGWKVWVPKSLIRDTQDILKH